MGWFQSKQEQLAKNLQEEQAYALAAFEIANGEIRPGLWAKAFAEASGNEQRAQGVYIKLRVAQVKLGVEVTEEMLSRLARSLSRELSLTPLSAPAPAIPDKPICNKCGSSSIASMYSDGEYICSACHNVQLGCKTCGFPVIHLAGNTYQCSRCHKKQLINH